MTDLKNKKSKLFLLTINNPKETDEEFLDYLVSLFKHKLEYFVFQREKGEEDEPEHISCFLSFYSYISISSLRKFFPLVHIEFVSKVLEKATIDYCKKPIGRIGFWYSGSYKKEK